MLTMSVGNVDKLYLRNTLGALVSCLAAPGSASRRLDISPQDRLALESWTRLHRGQYARGIEPHHRGVSSLADSWINFKLYFGLLFFSGHRSRCSVLRTGSGDERLRCGTKSRSHLSPLCSPSCFTTSESTSQGVTG